MPLLQLHDFMARLHMDDKSFLPSLWLVAGDMKFLQPPIYPP